MTDGDVHLVGAFIPAFINGILWRIGFDCAEVFADGGDSVNAVCFHSSLWWVVVYRGKTRPASSRLDRRGIHALAEFADFLDGAQGRDRPANARNLVFVYRLVDAEFKVAEVLVCEGDAVEGVKLMIHIRNIGLRETREIHVGEAIKAG